AAAATSLVTVATACSSDHPAPPANSLSASSTIASPQTGPASTPPTADASSSRTTPAPSDPRLAVQQAWTKFWSVNTRLHAIPPGEVESVIASVAVDPTLGQMRTELSLFASTHLTNYGYVVNHPYQTTLND